MCSCFLQEHEKEETADSLVCEHLEYLALDARGFSLFAPHI